MKNSPPPKSSGPLLEGLRARLERWLRLPPQPGPPAGSADAVRIFLAAPGFLRYRLFAWAVGSAVGVLVVLVLLLIVVALAFEASPVAGAIVFVLGAMFLALVLLAVGTSWVAVHLDYKYRWYIVTDRSLRIREGVFVVREMTMTFANIQNIKVTQGPIQRWFGIADLVVRSAGGSDTEQAQGRGEALIYDYHKGQFRGLDNAEEIRELMLARLRRSRDAGLGDTDDSAQPGAESAEIEVAQEAEGSTSPPPDLLTVLRRIRDETRVFRNHAERLTTSAGETGAMGH